MWHLLSISVYSKPQGQVSTFVSKMSIASESFCDRQNKSVSERQLYWMEQALSRSMKLVHTSEDSQ